MKLEDSYGDPYSPAIADLPSRRGPKQKLPVGTAGTKVSCHVPVQSCAYPLVILLLLDLLHLIKQLASSELQLSQLILGSDLGVVVGMLPTLDV